MKKSVVIKAKGLNSVTGFNIDFKTVLYLVAFICGLILGVTIMKNTDTDATDLILKFVKNSTIAITDTSIIKVFSGTFLSLFLLLFYVYIFGQCAVGLPFIWLSPLFLGLFSGIVVSSLYLLSGLKGIGYCCLVNLPCYSITAATLIKGCCIGTKYSNEIFLNLLGAEWKKGTDYTLKNYSISFLVLVVPLIIAALIKAGSCKLFGSLFVLF